MGLDFINGKTIYVFNRPDIVIRDKAGKKTYIIDISCPNDINVSDKVQEKITKYSGLRLELGRMWDTECLVVPVVIGSVGVVHAFQFIRTWLFEVSLSVFIFNPVLRLKRS